MINLQNEQNGFGPIKKTKADLEICDPMNNSKIMTKNCYLWGDIKIMFA